MEKDADLHFVGTAQPHWRPTEDAAYRGSMLRAADKQYIVPRMTELGERRETACPLVIDHAGLTAPGQKLDPDKKIGHISDVMVDAAGNVVTVGVVYGNRPESHALFKSMRAGTRWGLSFFTEMETDATTGDVQRLRLSHLGITTDPAWGDEGTWIHNYSDRREPFQRALRERYLARPGWTVAPATRRRYAAVPAPAPATRPAAVSAPSATHTRAGTVAVAVAAGPLAGAPARRPVGHSPPHSSPPAATTTMADIMAALTAALQPAAAFTDAVKPDAPVAAPAAAPLVPQAQAQAQAQPDGVGDLFASIERDASTITALPDSLGKGERVKALQKRVQDLWREDRISMGDIVGRLAPTMSALDAVGKSLEREPLEHIGRLAAAGALEPKSAAFMQHIMANPGAIEDSRVICDYVSATAHSEAKNQKGFEKAREESRAAHAEKATLKRKLDEVEPEVKRLTERLGEFEAAFKNLPALLAAKAAAAAAAPAPPMAAAVAASAGTSAAELARHSTSEHGACSAADFQKVMAAVGQFQYSPSAFHQPSKDKHGFFEIRATSSKQ